MYQLYLFRPRHHLQARPDTLLSMSRSKTRKLSREFSQVIASCVTGQQTERERVLGLRKNTANEICKHDGARIKFADDITTLRRPVSEDHPNPSMENQQKLRHRYRVAI